MFLYLKVCGSSSFHNEILLFQKICSTTTSKKGFFILLKWTILLKFTLNVLWVVFFGDWSLLFSSSAMGEIKCLVRFWTENFDLRNYIVWSIEPHCLQSLYWEGHSSDLWPHPLQNPHLSVILDSKIVFLRKELRWFIPGRFTITKFYRHSKPSLK